jgi:hypothetical protein
MWAPPTPPYMWIPPTPPDMWASPALTPPWMWVPPLPHLTCGSHHPYPTRQVGPAYPADTWVPHVRRVWVPPPIVDEKYMAKLCTPPYMWVPPPLPHPSGGSSLPSWHVGPTCQAGVGPASHSGRKIYGKIVHPVRFELGTSPHPHAVPHYHLAYTRVVITTRFCLLYSSV